MRTIVTAGLIILCISVAAPTWAVAGPPPGEDWVSLFDGTDLTGWKVPEGDNGHWKVVDGVIDYDAQSEAKGNKDLWTEESYSNFVLHIDWRIKETKGGLADVPIILPDGSYKTDENGQRVTVSLPNADSGILLRPKVQANIWCWPIGSGEVWSYRLDGNMSPEVRAGATPKVCADNPVGQWNTFVITMNGDRLTIVLNGKTVIDNLELPGVDRSGPIGLQHHGGIRKSTGKWSTSSSLMQFREIHIKELP